MNEMNETASQAVAKLGQEARDRGCPVVYAHLAPLRTSYPAPIAYTFEADHHCPACTANRFGVDRYGSIPRYATDNEGDGIGAIAPWDEWQNELDTPQTLACGTCGTIIEEYVPAIIG